jgi:tetratricopeptide (TPR) repeat protein
LKRETPQRPQPRGRPAPPDSRHRATAVLLAWLPGLLLLTAVLAIYRPVWHAGYIWDDDRYVYRNELLSAPDGLQRIWLGRDLPSQYFPLVYTTFRFEHALWGVQPDGYHIDNILLHGLNCILLWRLLRRLNLGVAALLAAAIFALHPVHVESVAWITERKNVLSLFFSLLTMFAWLGSLESARGRRWRYGMALVCFALALFSKTTACTLPAAMLAVLWFKHIPITARRLGSVAPFLVLGIGMGFLTMWWERSHMGTQGGVFTLTAVERLLVASRAVWFYAGKLFWPTQLTFSYPRWHISTADPWAYTWPLACLAAIALIWTARRFIGRGLECAAFFYAATLSPVLGFIMLYTFRYTFVADHYQYVASIGPIAFVAAAIVRLAGNQRRRQIAAAIGSGVLLAILAALTARQASTYVDAETLWRTTIARNPSSFLARNNLGAILVQTKRLDEAVSEYRHVLAMQPDDADAHYDFANCLVFEGRFTDAIPEYEKALQLKPDHVEAHNSFAALLDQLGRTGDAIGHWEKAVALDPHDANAEEHLGADLLRAGRVEEAVGHFRKVLDLQPGLLAAENNLAWILATCPLDSLRNGPEAVALAQEADHAQPNNPDILSTLAAANAEAGRLPDALSIARQARDLAAAGPHPESARVLDLQIATYEAGQPCRDSSQTNRPHH